MHMIVHVYILCLYMYVRTSIYVLMTMYCLVVFSMVCRGQRHVEIT